MNRADRKLFNREMIAYMNMDKKWFEKYQALAAELEKVKRERDAAVRDCARFPCYTCNERENGDFCHQCRTTGTFRALHEWRGLCAENGGIEK